MAMNSNECARCRTGDEAEQGMSMVHVAVEGRGLVGSLAFRDTLRPDARAVVQRLKDLHIRVALLSGDNAAAVTAAAQQAGIQVPIAVLKLFVLIMVLLWPTCQSTSRTLLPQVMPCLQCCSLPCFGSTGLREDLYNGRCA